MSCTSDVCGTGDWSGPKPGDPDNNAVLSANGTFGGIEVSWTYPNTNSHAVAHTLLYRSIGDKFETAIQHAIVSGNRYFDRETTDPIRTYYYWIRFVSINGTLLEPIGPAAGYALDELDKVITGMAGRIEAGLLATSLRSRIDTIATLEKGITDLDTRVSDETGILTTTLQGVQSDIDDALAYFEQERDARLLADGALATAINTTVAKAKEDLYAAIEVGSSTQAKINGDLKAQYTVKTDLAGHVAGFGLASSGNVYDGTIHSEFGVQADSFWVAGPTTVSNTAPTTDLYHGKVWVNNSNPDAPVTKYYNKETETWQTTVVKGSVPFIVRTSPDPDTGAPAGVYIDSAYISSITANQIDTRGLSIKDQDGNIILAAGTSLDWNKIGGQGKPADGATKGAPAGTLVNGVKVEDITKVVTDFNASNNRKATPVGAPVLKTDGAAVERTIQTNGTADIDISWLWYTSGVVTGSISGSTLTVTGVTSGQLSVGMTLAGTDVAEGTYIKAFGANTTGGNGTYILNANHDTLTSRTITGTCSEGDIDGFLVTVYQKATSVKSFNAASNVDPATSIISFSAAHGFVTGQHVYYTALSGTTIGGLLTGTLYYVIKVTDTTLKLATTEANAKAGTFIDITKDGSDATHTLTGAAPYTLGTTVADETIYTVPADKRSLILYGMAPDKAYAFGVQAYRAVDKAINAKGVIESAIVKPTRQEENPFIPYNTTKFTGHLASSAILNVATSGTSYVAGLRVGDLAWNATGDRTSGKGVAITPSGILGHNGTKSTFAINATTGDATFGGTLSVASGTSGERMEITNSVIKVYDAAGVLRVKLGNLA